VRDPNLHRDGVHGVGLRRPVRVAIAVRKLRRIRALDDAVRRHVARRVAQRRLCTTSHSSSGTGRKELRGCAATAHGGHAERGCGPWGAAVSARRRSSAAPS
jgi:hypothetical protein